MNVSHVKSGDNLTQTLITQAMIQRTTELRHLEAKKVHEISLILDEYGGWKRVMALIPKKLDSSYSYDGVDWEKLTYELGSKYTNDEIRKLETPRPGDSRLPAEIFIDEWSTSGKRENRATVGMFLQLLVSAELFRAADIVAQKWLGEELPKRPTEGPAAPVNTSLSEYLNEVASYAGDSHFQPDTEDLHIQNEVQMNGKVENNQDYYTKFRYENKNFNTIHSKFPPMPAPRKNRKSERLQSQEQIANHQSTIEIAENVATTTATMNGSLNGEHENKTTVGTTEATESTEINATQELPLLPVFFPQMNSNDAASSNSATTVSTTIESSAPIPLLSALQESVKSDSIMTDVGDLPAISALNLNGQHDNVVQSENHINENQQNGVYANDLDDDDSNDVDDDNEENSLSKMGSSNNDSSLTNITGTSGENSFELSSSSTSNENIPLNVLQY